MKGIKRIMKWSVKYIPYFLLILTLSTVLQWLYSYLPLFVQYVFKCLEGNEDPVALPNFLINVFEKGDTFLEIVLLVSASMVILQAIRSVMRFLCNYYQGALSHYIGYDMRIKIYDHVCDLNYGYHNNSDIGDLIQRSTSDVDTISSFISAYVPNFINIFVTVGIGAYQVYKISPIMMLISIIIVPFTALSSIFYFKYCNKQAEIIEQAEADMTTVIQENVNSARVVRAFANERYEFEKMDKASKKYCDVNGKFLRKMALFWGFSDASVFFQYALTITSGIILAKNGVIDSSDIVACLLLMGMLIWPMRGLGRMIANFGKAAVSANRIGEVLDIPTDFTVNGTLTPEIKGNIEFKNVSFKFDDDNKHLLNNISFKVKSGQTIALVGRTGSGKSTICNILTRMLEYDEGEVLLDGVRLKDIEKKHLRRNVRLVLQDPFLYSKNVYDNIAITTNNIEEEKIYNAAEIAAIHNEVLKFEKGYKTIVGEKGTTLSGGQKQRVAIARMLVNDSPVIIFDDSLSALDTKTDSIIRKALKKKNKNQTMIIITHRTTTAKEADLILVLDNGQIVQSGSHDELVLVDGLYKELWGIQGDLETEFINLLKEVQ
jgi:ATP-binding cassette subfamily B protein